MTLIGLRSTLSDLAHNCVVHPACGLLWFASDLTGSRWLEQQADRLHHRLIPEEVSAPLKKAAWYVVDSADDGVFGAEFISADTPGETVYGTNVPLCAAGCPCAICELRQALQLHPTPVYGHESTETMGTV